MPQFNMRFYSSFTWYANYAVYLYLCCQPLLFTYITEITTIWFRHLNHKLLDSLKPDQGNKISSDYLGPNLLHRLAQTMASPNLDLNTIQSKHRPRPR